MDCIPPGSSIHGILQARILEWVDISFSRGSSRPRDWSRDSCISGRRFNFWATRELPLAIHKSWLRKMHFLLLHTYLLPSHAVVLCLIAQSCPPLCDPMDWSPPGSTVHRDSPGKTTGVCSHPLLQGIFPTQRSNPGLLHCGQILYCLSHQGGPGILKWVAYPFSRETSQPTNWTGAPCIAGGFFTSWATREAHTPSYPRLTIKLSQRPLGSVEYSC